MTREVEIGQRERQSRRQPAMNAQQEGRGTHCRRRAAPKCRSAGRSESRTILRETHDEGQRDSRDGRPVARRRGAVRTSYAPFLSFAAARAEHCGFGAMATFVKGFKEG